MMVLPKLLMLIKLLNKEYIYFYHGITQDVNIERFSGKWSNKKTKKEIKMFKKRFIFNIIFKNDLHKKKHKHKTKEKEKENSISCFLFI